MKTTTGITAVLTLVACGTGIVLAQQPRTEPCDRTCLNARVDAYLAALVEEGGAVDETLSGEDAGAGEGSQRHHMVSVTLRSLLGLSGSCPLARAILSATP